VRSLLAWNGACLRGIPSCTTACACSSGLLCSHSLLSTRNAVPRLNSGTFDVTVPAVRIVGDSACRPPLYLRHWRAGHLIPQRRDRLPSTCSMARVSIRKCRYAVFGLGDSVYQDNYNVVGSQVDMWMVSGCALVSPTPCVPFPNVLLVAFPFVVFCASLPCPISVLGLVSYPETPPRSTPFIARAIALVVYLVCTLHR
jgi:hypothetical protein